MKKNLLLLMTVFILSCSSIRKPSYIPLSEIDFVDRLDDYLQLVIYYKAIKAGDEISYITEEGIKQVFDYKLVVNTPIVSNNLEILKKLNDVKLDKVTDTDYFLVKALVEIRDENRLLSKYAIAVGTPDIIKVNGVYYNQNIKPFIEVIRKFVPISARRYFLAY